MGARAPAPPSAPLSAPPAPPGRLPRLVQWLLRVPLFYKILLANATLVLVGAVGNNHQCLPWQVGAAGHG